MFGAYHIYLRQSLNSETYGWYPRAAKSMSSSVLRRWKIEKAISQCGDPTGAIVLGGLQFDRNLGRRRLPRRCSCEMATQARRVVAVCLRGIFRRVVAERGRVL